MPSVANRSLRRGERHVRERVDLGDLRFDGGGRVHAEDDEHRVALERVPDEGLSERRVRSLADRPIGRAPREAVRRRLEGELPLIELERPVPIGDVGQQIAAALPPAAHDRAAAVVAAADV